MVAQQVETNDDPRVSNTPEIRVTGIGKRYGASTVLQDVSLTLAPGEIHGILGENGAGKSTLLKILGGAIVSDFGTLALDGVQVKISNPRDSIAHGISLIAQELALIPGRTVFENVFLGRWSNTAGVARNRSDSQEFARLVEETGFDLDPYALVRDLPIGKAQQVEILKALARGARVLCMDEPTAVLNEAEKTNLLKVIRKLARQGTTVILVSHYLEEVLGLADRVTILRDGRHVTTDEAADHTPATLVSLMVGREVDLLVPQIPPVPADAPVVLEVEGLTTQSVHEIDLSVRAGEILGIAGLVGSGRSETLLAIFGADRVSAGRVKVRGQHIPSSSIQAAIRAGLALVPESRKDQGLLMSRPISENIALATLSRRSFGGFVRAKQERVAVASISAAVDLRGARQASISSLSGGNQQKALFAKWLLHPPAVLLVDEPTRGVDIAAKARIHSMIAGLAEKGTAVIVVSSELEEVLGLSHRVHVMRHGRIVDEFTRNAARDDVMASAFLK